MSEVMNYVFESKEELKEAIKYFDDNGEESGIKKYGIPNNWDVSNVTDMSNLFENTKFNYNISSWDVSNVTNMKCMFKESSFNGDISSWDISNVTNMDEMFDNCPIIEKHKPGLD